MEEHPAVTYTDELLALTKDLDRAAASDFVLRVFDSGADHGSHETLANIAAAETEKDAQIRRLAERLVALGEDPLDVARLMREAG
ncbi:hypothetical protein DN069_11555 [Streptacidiphilus pinicola]|uniref:Uncharacterized protein n=1 Tax=Streptacidiphilus pinicola TaxID=2219663 RepID=A0A2X0IQU8_9ACTN|nr:hypothetical protein [Streptacidiphilus pinicola]RAG85561.1 hypothetical protein DN069_11555 [Streptacidiphilus pinicola]